MLLWHPISLWMLAATVAGGPFPIGNEFKVNQTLDRPDHFPSVCVDDHGRFLVSWAEDLHILARAFDANGIVLAPPAVLTGPESAAGRRPACDLNSAGNGAVVWAGGLPKTVALRRVTGSENIDPETIGLVFNEVAGRAAASTRGDGEILVSWWKDGSVLGLYDLWVQRVSADGAPIATPTRVAQDLQSANQFPIDADVAWLDQGRFVVVWAAEGQDTDQAGVRARLYGADGQPETEAFLVNTYQVERQVDPEVDADAFGRFVVVWDSFFQDGSGEGIYAQRFDAQGVKLGPEIQVSSSANSGQYEPSISVDRAGNFAISYSSTRETNDLFEDVFLRVFQPDGAPLGDQVLVSQQPPYSQDFSSIALSGNGTAIVTWHSEQLVNGQIDEDIMARRFLVPCLEGGTSVLTLGAGRFSVCAQFATAQGWAGNGQAIPLSSASGAFWFFDPEILELVVKVIDGCSYNGHHWVYAAGLTNVEVAIQVTDNWTGETWLHENPLGVAFQPAQDIEALQGCSATAPTLSERRTGMLDNAELEPRGPQAANEKALSSSACVADATHLCLLGGRFRVSAEFATSSSAEMSAVAAPLLDDSGAFWFFSPDNLELFVKVIDGCGLTDSFWVFAAGLTNLQVRWRVEDTWADTVQPYFSALWEPFAPVLDTAAFATCPQ